MFSSYRAVLVFLAALSTTAATVSSQNVTTASNCSSLEQRKAWHKLTTAEQQAYINADLCLMSLPAKMGFPGAQTRWDELQFAHINSTNVVHAVGGFLPWHRFYMYTHLTMLREECNYTGAQPYWEEVLDADDLMGSVIFDPITGFGGNGTGDDSCVTDGPFANLTLHLGPNYDVTDHCLSRAIDNPTFSWANQTYLDECYAAQNYSTAWPLIASKPHSAAHLAVGGILIDIACSPGDPIFFLHHTNLDRIWWNWQAMDLPARLYDMDGPNVPSEAKIIKEGMINVTSAWTDYDGDGGGNVTTLNHTLSVLGILPNATVSDVMDIRGGMLCYEYV